MVPDQTSLVQQGHYLVSYFVLFWVSSAGPYARKHTCSARKGKADKG